MVDRLIYDCAELSLLGWDFAVCSQNHQQKTLSTGILHEAFTSRNQGVVPCP